MRSTRCLAFSAVVLSCIALGCGEPPASDETHTTLSPARDWIEQVSLSRTQLDVGEGIEFDYRLGITPAANNDDIEAIEVTFPDGHAVHFERDVRQVSTDHEHDVGLRTDPEFGAVWLYQNIGLEDLDDYPAGEYTLIVRHATGTSAPLAVAFCDPESDPDFTPPPLPEILEPADGASLAGGATIVIAPLALEAAIFLGRQPRPDETDSGDFAEERLATIAAGEASTGFIELTPGTWGGDVGAGIECEGEVEGVTWNLSVSSATEVDFEVKP